MSGIDEVKPEHFFAELLLPLRHAVARRNIHYLRLERGAESYWSPVVSRTGGIEKLTSAECDAGALLQRLGQYWAARGDDYLPKLVPYLIALRTDIIEAKPKGEVSEPVLGNFVYPLF